MTAPADSGSLRELATLFLRLGATAFGGPAAHISVMEQEVVRRRGWMSHADFLDLLGITNLIPGPNSTEMAIHIGYRRAGAAGLIVAGACFILPAVLITLVFAHLYAMYGSTPGAAPFLTGVRPAVIALIAASVYRLGLPKAKDPLFVAAGTAVLLLSLAGVDEVLLLISGGILGVLLGRAGRPGGIAAGLPVLWTVVLTMAVVGLVAGIAAAGLRGPAPGAQGPSIAQAGGVSSVGAAASGEAASLTGLGLFFLEVGSVLYGSGYVLAAYLQGGLVEARHWVTQQQLFDAIAIGQWTPGPVLSSATFVGYLVLGLPGASVATLGIFLPSFLFVALVHPAVAKLRGSRTAAGFLDGVNAASLGLMLAVAVRFGTAVLTAPGAWAIFVAGALLVASNRVGAAWIVAGSAVAGWLLSLFPALS